MLLSGFSFVRNANRLYYPVAESVRSILPAVDEFVLVYCAGDEDDNTLEVISAIGDKKLRILERPWPGREEAGDHVYSYLTNQALDECSGEWCFYLQADEVAHEDDLPALRKRCESLAQDGRVQAMLFDYLHFWGDYRHYHRSHGWYRKEIRIVRNGIGLRSKGDAQSFRFRDGGKAVAAESGARIFHYGYTRPPDVMKNKVNRASAVYHGEGGPEMGEAEFDYGPLERLAVFEGTHPAVMKDRIAALSWQGSLRETDPPGMKRSCHKHERLKYRMLTALENATGWDLGHKNYRKIIRG
ncbi:MAG: hypothetical protein JW909_00560 [Planctomycetes bacterium]|nr:hypothetical protein [Planctomycetota bacterium]